MSADKDCAALADARSAGQTWRELDAVALGQAIAFIPASVASRHAVPDLAFVPVTDLSPSTVAAAWPEGSRSPAIARFLRTAAEVAASHGTLDAEN